jgi:hypothetical protein
MDRPSSSKTDRVRAFCLALPQVTERTSHGEASWFVGKRQFASMADHHHDERLAVWLAAPDGAQAMLIGSHPGRFFRPPYVGVRGWLGIYLDVEVDWVEVGIMVERAHRLVAGR